jgi:hypothetical protein
MAAILDRAAACLDDATEDPPRSRGIAWGRL